MNLLRELFAIISGVTLFYAALFAVVMAFGLFMYVCDRTGWLGKAAYALFCFLLLTGVVASFIQQILS